MTLLFYRKHIYISLQNHEKVLTQNYEKVMRKLWESHEKVKRKSWEIYEKFMRRLWKVFEKVYYPTTVLVCSWNDDSATALKGGGNTMACLLGNCKNLAYRRHWTSWHVRIVANICWSKPVFVMKKLSGSKKKYIPILNWHRKYQTTQTFCFLPGQLDLADWII